MNFFSVLIVLFIALIAAEATDVASSQKPEGVSQNIAEDHIQKIIKSGVLRVAMHKRDHPPFFMVSDQGQLVGIDIELAHEIATRLGVRVIFDRSEDTFNGVVQLVRDGKADIAISKLSLTMERAKYVLYTEPYISMSKAILVNRVQLLKSGSGQSVKEIFMKKGAALAVLTGSSYEDFAKRIFPQTELYDSPNWDGDIMKKLFSGEIWGAFRDEIEVRRTIFLTPDASLYLLAVNLQDEKDPMMMVVHKEARLFRNWLNLFLKYIYKKEPLTHYIERFRKYVYRMDADDIIDLKKGIPLTKPLDEKLDPESIMAPAPAQKDKSVESNRSEIKNEPGILPSFKKLLTSPITNNPIDLAAAPAFLSLFEKGEVAHV